MAEGQYGKYIVSRPRDQFIEKNSEYSSISFYVDDQDVKGAYYIMGNWITAVPGKGTPDKEHVHDFDEYLGFIGSNPDDPFDLGGEIEFYLGGEKHIITKTSMIFLPKGVPHTPVYFKRVDRPILYLATGPKDMYAKEIKE